MGNIFLKNCDPLFCVARKIAPPPDLPVGIGGQCLAIFSSVVEDAKMTLKNRGGSGGSPLERKKFPK